MAAETNRFPRIIRADLLRARSAGSRRPGPWSAGAVRGPGLAGNPGLSSAAEHVAEDPADGTAADCLRGAAVLREVRR
jgi:hypothetical protein